MCRVVKSVKWFFSEEKNRPSLQIVQASPPNQHCYVHHPAVFKVLWVYHVFIVSFLDDGDSGLSVSQHYSSANDATLDTDCYSECAIDVPEDLLTCSGGASPASSNAKLQEDTKGANPTKK